MGQRKAFLGRKFQSLAVRGKKLLTQTSSNIQEWWQENHAIYRNNDILFGMKFPINCVRGMDRFFEKSAGVTKRRERKIKILGAGSLLYLMRVIACTPVSRRATCLMCFEIARTISVADAFCCSSFFIIRLYRSSIDSLEYLQLVTWK